MEQKPENPDMVTRSPNNEETSSREGSLGYTVKGDLESCGFYSLTEIAHLWILVTLSDCKESPRLKINFGV